ncbi:nucleoside diphosphate kinase-like [Strongylocentrotus purpuratus]|uniref:nucleoside-diphosphate kinase n=1 Tax=Strongylocentrotus purpuratus TaxID=7668 RepID=A0A7M7P1M4_STRPU|nr:nucleoside diphosphate kinase-like [Strongylocentrotus purpuratus]
MASRVYTLYLLAALFIVSSFFVADNDANFNTTAAERNAERTFIMVTPGGVQRGLIGDIVHRFEKRGYKMIAGKMMTTTEDLFRVHYVSHQTTPFFDDLLKLFSSVPVFAMVWEGKDIVKHGRAMLFGDDDLNPMPGTIRGDYSVDIHRKVCHGSGSVEEANMDIELWFQTEEIINYTLCTEQYLYEYI